MDTKKLRRLELIRERHRKLILEPKRKIEGDLFDDWADDDEFAEDEMLASELRFQRQ